ncbi:MAG: helix-turn-helix transcriptional regulator [Bdellovibrionales bacterium]|nr:helix-turn-helix transcriptional regulator [Bdellovibrionales bacterium]
MKDMRKVLHDILDEDLSPGEALRALRIKNGISQDDLQEITGIARTNISALENGRLDLTAHYAVIFAVALKTHPADLLFPNGKYEKNSEVRQIEKKAEAFLKKRVANGK